jgi:hypothetical protein
MSMPLRGIIKTRDEWTEQSEVSRKCGKSRACHLQMHLASAVDVRLCNLSWVNLDSLNATIPIPNRDTEQYNQQKTKRKENQRK